MRSVVAWMALLLLAACGSSPRAPVVERSGVRATPAPAPVRAPSITPSTAPALAPAADGYYVVKRGDTLYSIALDHGVDYRDVAQWNGLADPTRIRVGQALRVAAPQSDSVQVGRAPALGPIEAHPLAPGPQGATQTPKLGTAKPGAPSPKPTVVAAAPAAASLAAIAPAAPGDAVVNGAQFIWPIKGKILSGFSEPRSKGIDIDGKVGEPVVAAAAGRVTYVGNGIPGLGKLVVIKHDNGFITVYAHNSVVLVKEQQKVARGQKIAEVGTSDSDRPKLHFQIRKGAAAVDPLRYLPPL